MTDEQKAAKENFEVAKTRLAEARKSGDYGDAVTQYVEAQTAWKVVRGLHLRPSRHDRKAASLKRNGYRPAWGDDA